MESILQYFWKNKSFFMLIAVTVLAALLLQQCNHNKYVKQKEEQNFHALTETVTTLELKNGELISQRAIFVGSIDELKTANSELYNIVNEIKKSGSKPLIVTETKFVFIDSGRTNNKLSTLKDDNYALDFEYNDSDSIIYIKGKSNFNAKPFLKSIDANGKYDLGININSKFTEFDEIKFKAGLVIGIKKDKDGIERAFAKSEPFSKKITFTNIDAAEVDKFYKEKYKGKIKRFGIGPTIGYGVSLSPKGGIKSGVQLGVGINYSLIRF